MPRTINDRPGNRRTRGRRFDSYKVAVAVAGPRHEILHREVKVVEVARSRVYF